MKLKLLFSDVNRPEVKTLLLQTLKDLGNDDFKSFKWHLENSTEISESELEGADRQQTVNLLVRKYRQQAIKYTIKVLTAISRNNLVQRLSETNPGGKTQLTGRCQNISSSLHLKFELNASHRELKPRPFLLTSWSSLVNSLSGSEEMIKYWSRLNWVRTTWCLSVCCNQSQTSCS